MSLFDDAILKHLRRPFTAGAVKFRADGKPDVRKRVRCLTYIDSRLASERLTEVDPGWEASYSFAAATPADPVGLSYNVPVVCRLTVLGVTREGVGQIASSSLDDKYAKAAFSDALKRAAVDFGIGAYLYTMGNTAVDEKGYWINAKGNVGGLTADGLRQLRSQYSKHIGSKEFVSRFGEPVDYGDVEVDAIPAPVVVEGLSKEEKLELSATCALVGLSEEETAKVMDKTTKASFKRVLAAVRKRGESNE